MEAAVCDLVYEYFEHWSAGLVWSFCLAHVFPPKLRVLNGSQSGARMIVNLLMLVLVLGHVFPLM